MLIRPADAACYKILKDRSWKQAKFVNSQCGFSAYPLPRKRNKKWGWDFHGIHDYFHTSIECNRSSLHEENGIANSQVLRNTWIHEYMSRRLCEKMCCWVERHGPELFTLSRVVVESCSFMVSPKNWQSRQSVLANVIKPFFSQHLIVLTYFYWKKKCPHWVKKSNQYDNLCIFYCTCWYSHGVQCLCSPQE